MTNYVGLDVGTKRIGVAKALDGVKIAIFCETINVDGQEIDKINKLIEELKASVLVIGYPRNQSGVATAQTKYVIDFAKNFKSSNYKVVFQDESLTSIVSENILKLSKKKYQKGDIDAGAAQIILQDYLETM